MNGLGPRDDATTPVRMTARQRAIRIARLGLAHGLYATGLLQLWQRVTMRRKAVVLMYHRVLTGDEQRITGSHPAIVVSRDTFATHVAVLKRHFNVLSVQQLADHLERRQPLPDRACVITFDDGWQDSLSNALPVLQAAGLPSVVFLPVNFIGARRLFVREALTHLLVRAVILARQDPAQVPAMRTLLAPAGLAHILDIPDANPRLAVIYAIGEQPVMASAALEQLANTLPGVVGAHAEDLAVGDGFVDWDGARQLAAGGMDLGGHGTNHRLLTDLAPQDVRDEVEGCKRVVESQASASALAFSYPNGRFSPAIADTVRHAGYRLAFTTQHGHVTSTDDPFALRRINIHQGLTETAPMLMARLVGLY